MKIKRIEYIQLIYVLALFFMYQFLLEKTGYSINVEVYGLYLVLIFFYKITENLNFLEKKIKYDTIFINAFVFGIYFLFYKKLSIFLTFILFTLFQTFLFKVIQKLSLKRNYFKESYTDFRSLVKVFIDAFSILLAIVLMYFFKYEKLWYQNLKEEYLITYLGIFLVGYIYMKMNQKSWSYTNILDISNLLILNGVSSLLFLAVIGKKLNLSLLLLGGLTLITSLALQLFFRFLFKLKRYYLKRRKNFKEEKKVLIYGAGEAGTLLVKEAFSNKEFPYQVVGFIDDDIKKMGTYIYDIKVLGNRDNIKTVIRKNYIELVIIALPSLDNLDIKKIVDEVQEIEGVEVKIVPFVSNLVMDSQLLNQIREVRVEDLLGREQIDVNSESIKNLINGNTIFITGGAGSIGSELSRQIAKFSPKKIVNIDINENSIYLLELDMKRKYPNLDLVSEICSVRDKNKLETLFDKYRPSVVFHAAAHKHVPLMEHNPEEAIKNNIFGTKNVAECAEKFKVNRMVLISTDKAVNPTNVMGATKRACELVIQNMNKVSTHTKYMAVRFGNVLGSNGSVIPIFKKLLEENKNLTLTHKDITRYFMTIPEAAQLVIEAGTIGEGGEIFILDMGKPIKIYDLAKTMIKLSNSKVGIDIVGLRPGEKLYEELLYDVTKAIKTDNKKIFITKIDEGQVDITKYYDKLSEVMKRANVEEIKELMKEVVISYKEVKYN